MEEANVHSTPGKSRKTVLQRKASRAKEKLFQTLGKADKTRDEGFETYVGNFAKQQASANNLSKEIRRYVSSVKAMEMSAKSLYDALAEVHEPEWVEHNVIEEASQKSLEIWVDYMKTLQDSVVEPMTQYQAKFTDVRQRIDKRGRKLVDFDSARHHFNSLQHSKRQDDYKILKSHSELLEAKDLFDDINSTMYEQLPELYDSRIQTYVQLFQAIFNADTALHGQSAQLVQTLHQALGKLQVETAEGTYNCPRFEPVLPPTPTTPLSRATTPASTLRTPVLVGNSNKTPDAAIGVYDVARPANGPENNGPSTSVGIPDSPKTLTLTSNGHDGQAVNGRQSPKREDESGEVAVTNEDVKAVESHPPADAPVCNDSAAEVAAVKPENEEEKEKVDVGESLEESITATLMATSLTDDKKAADDDTPAEEQQGAVVNVAMTPENAEVAVSVNQVEQPPQMAAPTQNTEQAAAAENVKEDVKPHDGVKMDVWQETTEVTHGDTHQSTQVTETTSVMKAEEGVSMTQETREVITKVITNTEDLGEKVAEKAEEKVEEVTQKVDDITQKVDDVTQKVEEVMQKVDDVTQKVEEVMQKVDDVTQKVEEVTQKVEDVTQKKVDDEYVPPGTLYTKEDKQTKRVLQDEGWLMGVVKSSRKKGVFPENFTSKKV
ncbi:PREDICTED: bridging integrator 2-like [Priapulus caudatus]|uniref:Bridging integrator 2-like n=1 Tax=Priapulus caudatus TaxID=37621 RepID=A0ABM1E1N4_PRICU|nr:PREDICTED: bridging integrator 2-like [Priapulus caudatus]